MSRSRRSRLLTFTVDPLGGLRIAAVRPNRSIAVVLRQDRAEAQYVGFAPAPLPWSDFGEIGHVVGSQEADNWAFSFWTTGPGGQIGIGVRVAGHVESACHELIEATSTPWRRYERWVQSGSVAGGHKLPLAPRTLVYPSPFREIAILNVLATVLARNAEYRERLADPLRVSRLATDLSNGLLGSFAAKGGMRRDTVDIVVALRRAGFFYPLGRPLLREETPAPDEVLAGVRARLEANPYRKGRHTDDATIMRIIRAAYLDVEPWPFAALVD